MKNYKHTTVLLNESINGLNIRSNGIYIDGTFGCGGHSKLILSLLGKEGHLIAIDRDPQAISIARKINDSRFSVIHGLFSSLENYVNKRGLSGKIDGILLDLGVSSPQISNAERGFSFMHDGPLDMRMDQTCGQPISEWLKTAKETDIASVLKIFGEERYAKRIANAIVRYNRKKNITRTKELSNIVLAAIPKKSKFKHPATRTFQAMRILINNELREIELVLQSSFNVLNKGGRLSVISFHSLEDRIVKHFIREKSRNFQIPTMSSIVEKELINSNSYQRLRILGKFTPSREEIKKNLHARSAILRIAEMVK